MNEENLARQEESVKKQEAMKRGLSSQENRLIWEQQSAFSVTVCCTHSGTQVPALG